MMLGSSHAAAASSSQALPCVVMAHGVSLTRHDGLPQFAERFAQAGYAVLVFDFRYLGDSGGQPRQRFRLAAQREDWRNAIAFARSQPGIDPDRIVLWGYSLSGGYVTTIAAQDHRVAAVLALCPFLNGLRLVLRTPISTAVRLLPRAIVDRSGRHLTMPVTGPVGARAAFTAPGEEEGFAALVAADSPWQNALAAGELVTLAFYRPGSQAAKISCPLWVGLAERDITVHRASIERLARRAPHGVLQRYPYDHFEPFLGQAPELIVKDQLDFLAQAGLAPVPG